MREWPFEGRESERALITSAFEASDVDLVVLTAPAGLGKTRLARQALVGLASARTDWVGATRAAAAIPFGATARLQPDDAPAGGVELIRATVRHVRGWGGRRHVAVGIDDAHLLDDASATLVAHLVREGAAFVIMTVRTGEPVADVLVQLWKEANARCLELDRLPATVIDKLIDHGAPGHVDAPGRRRLHKVASGNPLALRELLHGAQPGGLADLVAASLDRLEPPARQVVELVACGEPLGVPILEQLVGLAAVAAAEESGLIVVERSGARTQARLDHPLYGDVLRRQMPLSRAIQVYRALAGALLTTPLRRRGDTLLAAVWQVEAGQVTRPDVVRAGAWQAVGHADLVLAERLARAARAAEPTSEADRLLAEILGYRGLAAEAARVIPATPPADPAEHVPWAITRAEALYWGGDDADIALAALDIVGGHPAAEASRSWLLFFDGRCAEAAKVADGVLARSDADPKSLVWAAAAGAGAAGFLGRLGQTEQVHRRGASLAAAHAEALPWGAVEVDTGACLAYLAGGQPAAAEAIATAGYHTALDNGAPMMVSGWALYRGLAAAARGWLDEADRLLAEAQAGYEVNDSFRLSRCCLAARAGVAALRGDPDATRLMARADALAHPSNKVFEPWIESWRAWTAYASRDAAAAKTAASRAADLAREAGMPAVEALAHYELVRLGSRADLTRLQTIDHDLARLLARCARAIAARDGATTLEDAARTLQERGYDLHAAEAHASAAHQHHRHGRTAQANLAEANATRLRNQARSPLLHPAQLTTRLTPRERDVVLLAADHTSAQIATRLQLAVSTVNNILARAYTRLGITGRRQLRELLGGAVDKSSASDR